MAVASIDLQDMFLDLNGFLNAGGKVYTYASGTTTPLATYADKSGISVNANPTILDSSGQTKIWLTVGVSYKFVFTDANDVTIYTKDGIEIASGAAADTAFDLAYYFLGGPPTSSEELFRYVFDRGVNFAADWAGSFGSVAVNPATSFVETVQKNGSPVGTITTNTSGIVTFATSAGAPVSFVAGDVLTVIGPGSADSTVAGIARTFAGALA